MVCVASVIINQMEGTSLLFSNLNDDIFLIFSRDRKHLYARVISKLYQTFFSEDLQFPTRNEIVQIIYNLLKENPNLWSEDDQDMLDAPTLINRGRRLRRTRSRSQNIEAQDKTLTYSGHIYLQLIEKGWLEEEKFGVRKTVDMTPGGLALADRLVAIEGDISALFGGVATTVRDSLKAMKECPETSGQGLRQSVQTAGEFSRKLRLIISNLREIQRRIVESENLRERFETFFIDYIQDHMLHDFHNLHGPNHPAKLKGEIQRLVDDLFASNDLLSRISSVYLDSGVSKNKDIAWNDVISDLERIKLAFDHIEQSFIQIERFRRQLETRIYNMTKYAQMGTSHSLSRMTDLVQSLDQISDQKSKMITATIVEGTLIDLSPMWSHALFAPTRLPRTPVEPQSIRNVEIDPALKLLQRLKREFQDKLNMPDELVVRYLESRILPHSTVEAKYLHIKDLHDFLAFEKVRKWRFQMPEKVMPHFEILDLPSSSEEQRNDDWIRCTNFLVKRKTDFISLLKLPNNGAH
ncbi:MAG: hypothetical protein COB46_02080 [Rhodospirillaceae bacterium]|nr:MAG: hypothetical protein COB46_02080 [Rhodospirillaceae bacterium]